MEQKVKVSWEGNEVEITLKQLTWGDHKRIRSECVVLKEYNGKAMQFRDTDLMDDLKILSSIKTAPFDVKMENLDKLSESDRYKLATAVVLLDGEEELLSGKNKDNADSS